MSDCAGDDDGFDLSMIDTAAIKVAPRREPDDLLAYDRYVVAFSGGKDSLALVLELLERGVARERIELHHHHVDGREGSTLMDWPCTEAYCQAFADEFGMPLTFSWRVGGFELEMNRCDTATAPMMVPAPGGGYVQIGGAGPRNTRRMFPQLSASLTTRWCSSALKIGVFDAYIRSHPQFIGARTLVLTGERAEESSARANYASFERHRSDTRESKRVPRHVDVWRAVHGWSEARVWEIISRHRVQPHVAYMLGWGRLSCRQCIYGSKHQWASVRAIAPGHFNRIAEYEREFGVTIHRRKSVVEQADAGTPYRFDPKWVEAANNTTWDFPILVDPWVLPSGAYGEAVGPT